jgi:predicted phosphodiesterase
VNEEEIMKICVISDIHADVHAWSWDELNDVTYCDVLIVAGDISNNVWHVCHWLVEAKQRFARVIFVPGNHDFYNLGFHQTRLYDPTKDAEWPYPRTVPEMISHYSKWCANNGIDFLHRKSVEINGITFIGATGWHDYTAGVPYTTEMQIKTWYEGLNDTCILWNDNPTPNHLNPFDAGQRDIQAVQTALSLAPSDCVIITHHVPHKDLCWQKPHDRWWTMLHGSFANRGFENVRDPRIKYWIYGHTHNRRMNNLDGITFVCNARGYPNENSKWEPVILTL